MTIAIVEMLSPAEIVSWIAAGLVAGWLAGMLMDEAGAGIVVDLVLGVVGALVGGFAGSVLPVGVFGFWGHLVLACIGSWLLIGLSRSKQPRRASRL